jgi:hypothetical protein
MDLSALLSQLIASPTAMLVAGALLAGLAAKYPILGAVLSAAWNALKSGGKTPDPAPKPNPSPAPVGPLPLTGPLAEWLAQHPILAKLGAEGLHLLPLLLPLLMAKQGTDDPKLAIMKELAEQQERPSCSRRRARPRRPRSNSPAFEWLNPPRDRDPARGLSRYTPETPCRPCNSRRSYRIESRSSAATG